MTPFPRCFVRALLLAATMVLSDATAGIAQDSTARGAKKPKAEKQNKAAAGDKAARAPRTPPLFAADTPVTITFTTNVSQLRRDKADKAPWHPATLSYGGAGGAAIEVPARARTRGIWRLKNCEFPPVRLAFGDKASKNTLFDDLEKPKLVSYCRNNNTYEQYILQELQLYRAYRFLTPVSHHVRLLRINYADSGSGKVIATRWGFMVEDPAEMAARLNGQLIETKGAGAGDLEPFQAALAFLFQFMIGNTDFSFNGLHNGELVGMNDGGDIVPVAYDFDFAGAVNASYATVDPQMQVKRVRDRQYRGYCAHASQFPRAFAVFEKEHDAIMALYTDPVGRLMDARVARETVEYFEEFYSIIRDPRAVDRRIMSTCVGPR